MVKRKLLLADDSITIQKVVNLTFADEGIEVISVGDGDSAMEKITEYAPDLILADVNMPGLSGYQICEQIKQSDATRKIPVILLVGSFEPFDEAEAYRVGADDYLTKPFQSIRQLVTKVSELLDAADRAGMPEPQTEIEPESNETNTDFYNTVGEVPEIQYETQRFDDTALDDQMIETNQVGSLPIDETQKFISRSAAETNGASDNSFDLHTDFYRTIEAEEDYGKTAPLDISDLQTFSYENAEQTTNGAAIYEIVSEENESGTESAVAASVEEQKFSNQTAISDEDVFNFSPLESDDELSLYVSAQNASQPVSIDSFSSAPPFSDAQDFLFDDSDLLDLPPVEPRTKAADEVLPVELPAEFQVDTNTESAPQYVETEQKASFISQSESYDYTAENTEKLDYETPQSELSNGISAASRETEIDRQIAALSPELIDAIARRVAEQMSDKAIREIAWEVVPQMTDLIVRRMAEEKLKE